MAIFAFPFENADTSESQYSRLFSEFQESGVAASANGTDFRVDPNGTNLVLYINPGFAIIRGHAVDSTSIETRTLVPAEAQPRIDRIVLRLDPLANSVNIVALKGSASANPTAPGLTQTLTGVYDLPLAQISVPAAAFALSASNVTDQRRYVSNRVGVWTGATRPASPRRGAMGFNVSIGEYEYWNGSAWSSLAGNGKAADADKLDGVDGLTYARRDQSNNFAGTINVTAGTLQEGGQRVYSPNNPPPVTTTQIIQTVRGVAQVPAYSKTVNVTVPAVNMAKSQVRLLGVSGMSYESGTGSSVGGMLQLTTSTNLLFTASLSNDANRAWYFSYEITEWS